MPLNRSFATRRRRRHSRIPAKNKTTIIPCTHLCRPASPQQHFFSLPPRPCSMHGHHCAPRREPRPSPAYRATTPCTLATERKVPSQSSSASRLTDPLIQVTSTCRVSASASVHLHCLLNYFLAKPALPLFPLTPCGHTQRVA